MKRLSFRRRKATTNGSAVATTAAHAHANSAAPDSSFSPTMTAEIIEHVSSLGPSCPFQDRICVPTDPAGFGRGSENPDQVVGTGSISQPSLSSTCPPPPNTALPCTATKKICVIPPPTCATLTDPEATIIKRTKKTCYACRLPISRSQSHINLAIRNEEYRYYHAQCFKCIHCSAPIDPNSQTLCCAKLLSTPNNDDDDDDEDEHPLHQECFSRHFGYICVVCENPLPMVTTCTKIKNDDRRDDYNDANDKTKVTYTETVIVKCIKHPYFDGERMCPHHASSTFSTRDEFDAPRSKRGKGVVGFKKGLNVSHHTTTSDETRIGSVRRCAGCHRFEPKYASPAKHFVDVGDSDTGRSVCLACLRTVVMTNDDVVPLWEKVINFFEGPLGLLTSEDSRGLIGGGDGVTRQDLMNIPICMVGTEVMNERVKCGASGAHNHSISVTRGLCFFERTKPITSAAGGRSVGVTAILCLHGLPADLTASILAHEAFHAYLKLHPNFSCANPLPRRVEEGLAQLAAYLFLDGLDLIETQDKINQRGGGGREKDVGGSRNTAKEKDDISIPQEARLRQYFKFCIESDESIYGTGFRAAVRAYADLGIHELLYYVALNREFPL